jgi:hypothetical protein
MRQAMKEQVQYGLSQIPNGGLGGRMIPLELHLSGLDDERLGEEFLRPVSSQADSSPVHRRSG